MSNTTQIKPENLPVDLGKGNIQFVKRGDYAKRTAENVAIATKAELKRTHVEQILEALDKGSRELPPNSPEPFVKLFETVVLDYDAGIQKVKDDLAAEEKKKADEEKAAAEKKEKEDKLLATVESGDANLATIATLFDTGNMDRCIPKGDVTDEQLMGALKSGLKLGDWSSWMLGDLIVSLEDRGQLNVVQRFAEAQGQGFSTLYNNAKTCRAVPPANRTKGVSFTIYREVANAKFTADQAKGKPALLAEVAEGKHTTQTVRAAVQKLQGKTPPEDVLPELDTKKKFIVFDPTLDPEKQISVATGFPKDLLGGDATIIDPKTLLRFTNMKNKPENRWVEVEAYLSAAEQKAIEEAKKKKEQEEADAKAAAAAKKANKKSSKK